MKLKNHKKYDYQLLFLALPLLALVFLFSYLPLYGWSFAFIDYKPGVPILDHAFVGLKHFRNLFAGGSEFLIALRNILVFNFLGILLSPLPILFAIMLSEIRSSRLAKIIQTFTTLPNFISWVLVFSICFTFLSNDGLINSLLLKIGILDNPKNFLGDLGLVWPLQTIIAQWKSLGWSGILYIAAMAGIDQELYDAADVDGAGRLQKILHITIPGIVPTFIVLLLLSVSNMMNNGFEQYYAFHNALVHDRIEVIDTYVYRIGLGRYEFSFSTAVGMFKSLISVSLLLTVNQIAKKVRGEPIV